MAGQGKHRSDISGQVVGRRLAVGANWRNLSIWNRERASAILLSRPGTCLAENMKLCCIAFKVSRLISFIIVLLEDLPLLIMSTVAVLSQ